MQSDAVVESLSRRYADVNDTQGFVRSDPLQFSLIAVVVRIDLGAFECKGLLLNHAVRPGKTGCPVLGAPDTRASISRS